MFGKSAVQQLDEDSGKQNPTVLQLCSTYWQRLASLFCSFTTNGTHGNTPNRVHE